MSTADPGPRFKNTYRIRGTGRDTTIPHAACPYCHRDATSDDPGDLIEFRCERGHQWLQTRQASLAHATFLARYYAGIQENR